MCAYVVVQVRCVCFRYMIILQFLRFQTKSCFSDSYTSYVLCVAVRLAPPSSQESCTIQSTNQDATTFSLFTLYVLVQVFPQ